MFHIFTAEGLKSNVPLEKVLHHPDRVDRKGEDFRVRRFEEHGNDLSRAPHSYVQTGAEAYSQASHTVNLPLPEPIIHAYQIMSSPVVTLDASMSIPDAWESIRYHRLRYMPVMQQGKLAGILSDRDIFCSFVEENGRVMSRTGKYVSDIMQREIITSDPVTDVRRIAIVMFRRHIGAMPVVQQDGKITGIITRSDILHALVTRSSMDVTV